MNTLTSVSLSPRPFEMARRPGGLGISSEGPNKKPALHSTPQVAFGWGMNLTWHTLCFVKILVSGFF